MSIRPGPRRVQTGSTYLDAIFAGRRPEAKLSEDEAWIHIRLPKELHDRLVRMAAAERRSLNNLLTVLLDQAAAGKAGNDPE
jgi:predicted HicB family RNase H-like nuclease